MMSYNPDTGIFTRLIAPGKRSDLISKDAGCPQNQGYILIAVDNKKYKAHRLAWLYAYGDFPSKFIDHINNIKSDNRICNLREATKSQNLQNIPVRNNNTSGITGVYWNKAAKKWQAYIKLNGKVNYLGIFPELQSAITARKDAEKLFFKQFQYEKKVA